MKHNYKPLLTFIIVLASTAVCFAQTKESAIANIKTVFLQINRDSALKKITLENEDFLDPMPDNGCELTGYFKNDTICKINVWIGLSYCIRKYEYYFKDNTPVFIYETEEDYQINKKTGLLDNSKLIKAFEGRYYLHKAEVIDEIIKGKKRMENRALQTQIKDLLSDSRSYTKQLVSHLKK